MAVDHRLTCTNREITRSHVLRCATNPSATNPRGSLFTLKRVLRDCRDNRGFIILGVGCWCSRVPPGVRVSRSRGDDASVDPEILALFRVLDSLVGQRPSFSRPIPPAPGKRVPPSASENGRLTWCQFFVCFFRWGCTALPFTNSCVMEEGRGRGGGGRYFFAALRLLPRAVSRSSVELLLYPGPPDATSLNCSTSGAGLTRLFLFKGTRCLRVPGVAWSRRYRDVFSLFVCSNGR